MSSFVVADTDSRKQHLNTAGRGHAQANRLEKGTIIVCAFNGELGISIGSIHGTRSRRRGYLPTQALLLDTARRKSNATH
jgi:hypothetical protein